MTPKQKETKDTEDVLVEDVQPVSEPAKRGRPKREKIVDTDLLPLTLGVVLQQARQGKHMKLPSISKKLKIKEIYLEALEKGDYHVFPALVYGVGFLRSYATFLELNADEMVARFHKETAGIKEETLDMPRAHNPKILPSPKVTFWSLVVLFFLYLIWNWFQVMTDNPLSAIEKPVLFNVTEVVNVDEPAPLTADEIPDAEKTEDQAASETEATATQRTPMVYGLKTPARVSFVATDKTTVEIRDTEADSVLLKKDLEVGDIYNPVADSEGLVLKTTNAGGLDVYVDGKKIKALGKKGQTRTGVQMDAKSLLKD